MSCFAGLEAICQADAPLRDLTWYGLGGPARWLLSPRDADELAEVLRRCHEHSIPWKILGHGANLLVRDAGVDGAVIRLDDTHWQTVELDGTRIHAGGGADFPRLVKQSAEQGLSGLEGLAGIPGTVGGIVRMNAGGRYGNVGDVVESVDAVQTDGTHVSLTRAELRFDYRSSNLADRIVTRATFSLQPADRDATLARFRQIWTEKHSEQPAVSAKSAGCIFKNPPQAPAGKLIDDLGLKGTRCGGAEISTRHANFIVTYPGATASDVVQLIEHTKDRVLSETGTRAPTRGRDLVNGIA